MAAAAAANSSAPTLASSSLLAVTTGLPAASAVEDQLPGRLDAADDLDHDVDVGVVHHGGAVAGEDAFGEVDVALARQVAHGDGGDLQAEAGAGLDGVGLLGDQRHQRGADVAATQHPDPHDVRHGHLR